MSKWHKSLRIPCLVAPGCLAAGDDTAPYRQNIKISITCNACKAFYLCSSLIKAGHPGLWGRESQAGTGRRGSVRHPLPCPARTLRCATWLPLPAGSAAGHWAPPGRRPQDGARRSAAAPRPGALPARVAGTAAVSVNLLFV